MASNRTKLETPEYKARLLAFSERLKKERERLGITQGALAERAGLSGHAVISRWEAVADEKRGGDYISSGAVARELPDVNDILKLCELFGCEIAYLIGIQELPTRDATDISGITGLLEVALCELSDSPFSGVSFGSEHAKAMSRQAETMTYRATINLLLSNEHGKNALKLLSSYYFARLDSGSQENLPAFILPWELPDNSGTMLNTATLSEDLQREILLDLARGELRELRRELGKQK